MSDYQIYTFLLCVIVFIMTASLSIYCTVTIARMTLRTIRGGLDDTRILEEHEKHKSKKQAAKWIKIADYAFSGVVCLVLLSMLTGAFVIRCTDNVYAGQIPTYRVVQTGSMAKKHEKNTYLTENGLDNQIQTFDLIRTEKLPDEMDLQLYDIVVYEVDDMLIVHRIVEIEEPNEYHPDCRHFRMQGDAVESPDRFPVLYSQMRAIYRDVRIPYIGSFILFMQSPAGWLCTMFVLLALIAMPILDNKVQKATKERLLLILPAEPAPEPVPEPVRPITVPTATAAQGKPGEVNLGALNEHYQSGEIVDMDSLKAKKLISSDCKRIKILAHGELNKPLTVYAESFSHKAIAKITEQGGKAVRLQFLSSYHNHADTDDIA